MQFSQGKGCFAFHSASEPIFNFVIYTSGFLAEETPTEWKLNKCWTATVSSPWCGEAFIFRGRAIFRASFGVMRHRFHRFPFRGRSFLRRIYYSWVEAIVEAHTSSTLQPSNARVSEVWTKRAQWRRWLWALFPAPEFFMPPSIVSQISKTNYIDVTNLWARCLTNSRRPCLELGWEISATGFLKGVVPFACSWALTFCHDLSCDLSCSVRAHALSSCWLVLARSGWVQCYSLPAKWKLGPRWWNFGLAWQVIASLILNVLFLPHHGFRS